MAGVVVSVDGRNGMRCSPTPMGPTPGPPPPWGMQNVLCRFKWLTSDPNSPGLATPDQSIEVGTVGVHLSAGVVDQLADFSNGVLVHTVSGRVGDHHAASSSACS